MHERANFWAAVLKLFLTSMHRDRSDSLCGISRLAGSRLRRIDSSMSRLLLGSFISSRRNNMFTDVYISMNRHRNNQKKKKNQEPYIARFRLV